MSEEIKAKVIEDNSNDVDFKINLPSAKKEEPAEEVKDEVVEQEQKEVQETETEAKEEVKEEITQESEPEEKKTEEKISKEDVINQYLSDKYKIDLDSLDNVLKNNEKKQELPKEVENYLEYKKETKRGLDDYVKLQQNIDDVNEENLLRNYYKENNPGLDDSDVDFLINEKFAYTEDSDNEYDIKKKTLAKKQELFKAKEYFNNLKEKYKTPLESSDENVPENYKEAFKFFNNYKEESAKQEKATQTQREVFQEKTNKFFNDEFKGFEFNLGDSKLTYKPKDVNEIVNKNSDLTNFINKHVDENGLLKDAGKYHTALSMAMNPEKYAKFFYEQGKSDAVNEVVKDGKNIEMSVRNNVDSSKSGTQFKVLQDTASFSSGLKIKKR